jgi:hypothetical protein
VLHTDSVCIPVVRELESDNLRNDKRILQRQSLIGFIDSGLQQTRSNSRLVFLRHSVGRRLAPVLVDAVLELDDGKIPDLERQRLVQEDRLQQWIVAPRLFPLLQLLCPALDLLHV